MGRQPGEAVGDQGIVRPRQLALPLHQGQGADGGGGGQGRGGQLADPVAVGRALGEEGGAGGLIGGGQSVVHDSHETGFGRGFEEEDLARRLTRVSSMDTRPGQRIQCAGNGDDSMASFRGSGVVWTRTG